MKRKKSILRAYKRKWKRLPRKDQVFVIKFLGGAVFILIVVVVLICLLIARLVRGASGDGQALASNMTGEISAVAENDISAGAQLIQGMIGNDADGEGADNSADLDNEEVELLARLVYAEAGSDSDETQIAVASVILNRVASDSYPDTIADVIYQSGQYPSVTSGAIDQEPDDRAKENARYVYQNGSQIPSNVLYQSGDIQGSGLWAQLDGEYFCYE